MKLSEFPEYRKVPADSVPYGTDICTRGHSVWAAYSDGQLTVVAATKVECVRKYRALWNAEWARAGFVRA